MPVEPDPTVSRDGSACDNATMLGTVNLPTFTLGAVLIVLLPGPNSLYVLSVAARKGVRTGYRAACGVFLGDTALLTLTALGAASMLKRSPTLERSTSPGWASECCGRQSSRSARGARSLRPSSPNRKSWNGRSDAPSSSAC